jgi:hypothetical protein
MSFRAKREILFKQEIEKIRFLPRVEMTVASFSDVFGLFRKPNIRSTEGLDVKKGVLSGRRSEVEGGCVAGHFNVAHASDRVVARVA